MLQRYGFDPFHATKPKTRSSTDGQAHARLGLKEGAMQWVYSGMRSRPGSVALVRNKTFLICVRSSGRMRRHAMSVLKRVGVPALAAVSLIGGTLAFSGSADARYYHRGWRSGGLVGAAIVGGVAIGTTVPAPRSLLLPLRLWLLRVS